MLNKNWIVGFTEGEGCFSRGIQTDKSTKGNPRRKYPSFQVTQKDDTILYSLKKYFGFGHVCKSGNNCRAYQVRGFKSCKQIAKFFKGVLITPYKKKQFDNWCKEFKLLAC
jgi:hypothetical protein